MYSFEFNKFLPLTIYDSLNRLYIDVTLFDICGKSIDTKFVLDTGANNSVLSEYAATILNLEKVKESSLNGEKVSIVKIPIFSLCDKLKYTNLEMPKKDYSSYKGVFGLIGMDILGKYDFHISLSDSRLYLRNSSKPLSECRYPYDDALLSELKELLPSNYIKEASLYECLRKYEELYMSGVNHTEEEIIRHIERNS